MSSRSIFLIALTVCSVAADQLSLWLGEGCRNANLGTYSPVPEGQCIDMLQAQSYILQMNEGDTYELYDGTDCSQYEGDVTLSGTCLSVGDTVRSIMNVGNKDRLKIRGATQPLGKKSPKLVSALDVGDTYQCPNIPSGTLYFLAVTTSSAVEEDLGGRDQEIMSNDFMREFSTAYQNPSGQTQVSSYTPYDGENFEDVQMTLDMVSGVIQDFQEPDIRAIVADLFTFRDQQRDPINFGIDIYSGRPNGEHGIVAHLFFRGD